MLRSVVGALAPNMVLVQCNSDVPISLACSGSQGNSLELGIIGTASPGGPRKPAVRQATVGGPASQASFAVGLSERKSVPLTHIRCRMTQKGSTASFHPSKVASFASAAVTPPSRHCTGVPPTPVRGDSATRRDHPQAGKDAASHCRKGCELRGVSPEHRGLHRVALRSGPSA